MSILERIFKPKPLAIPVENIGDDDMWCYEDPDDPEFGLCGQKLAERYVPDAEVPDELKCKACVRIRGLLKKLEERK